MRVLVAEDDIRIASVVRSALEHSAFTVEVEGDGEVVQVRGESEEYDAVLLDLGLPTVDGLTILKRWRNAGRRMPIMIMTARGQWEERVEAIEAGADDYLVKPFRIEELLARLRAVIRRSNGIASARIPFRGLVLDTRNLQVSREGLPIDLTPNEYKVLDYLVQHRGEVVSQTRLLEHIYSHDTDKEPNAIEVLVGRLRRRLGDNVIRTRRGFGYIIEDDPA